MIGIVVFVVILILLQFFVLCIFIGAGKNKTKYEQMIEDQEQIEYLKNIANRKKHKTNKMQ